MAQVLLDTTFFIDLRRGDAGATRAWDQIERGDVTAAYSSVTVYELWLNKSLTLSDELFFGAMFALLEEAPLTSAAAKQTALWLKALQRRARSQRLRDAFIAASAMERGEAILTRDIRDMRRYHSDVRGY